MGKTCYAERQKKDSAAQSSPDGHTWPAGGRRRCHYKSMSLDPLVLEKARQEWLPRAEAGDCVAMAYLAIIQYLTDPLPEADARDQINNWLRRAKSSDDPEFLIALAEELVIGTAIYRDIRLARDFLDRALSLSELKGSYAMARFTVVHDRKRCLLCLERAADLGHVPSRQVLIFLRLHKKNRLSRHLHGLRHLPKMIGDAQKVFRGTAVREHWWRYKDVVLRKEAGLYIKLGEDRRRYFSWARPSSITTFSAVMAKGRTDTLMRGTIEADALRPQAVDEALKRPEVSQTAAT